jgi:signal transduction histidine kinase
MRSLFGKLVMVLLGFGAAVAVLSILVLRFSHEAYHLEASQYWNRNLANRLLSESIAPQRGELDASTLGFTFEHLMRVNPEIDIYLLDGNGRVLNVSSNPGSLGVIRVALSPIRRFLSGDENFPIRGDDPREPARHEIFSAAPVRLRGGAEGYLYVVLNGHERETSAQQLKKSYALREGAWVITGGVVVAILLSALIIAVLTRRLNLLASVMDRFRKGGFAEQATLKVNSGAEDEITRLTHAFNDMADRILGQMEELKLTDANRREMLANVSHDLRTPLTSLHGHLETLLLKEHELSDEEKRGYLEIAAKQSKRMGKLVNKLFELAKLDAREPELTREPFMLSELVQDVVQKFELDSAQRKVTINALLPEDLPLVIGDIGLIERVLDNLVENALRYTPAGGKIDITLSSQDGYIAVRVADTGSGITKEDLPKIFDRLYRSEKNRPSAPDSAGLGLAIVKRILELHGASVVVESTVGAGTSISFKLPAHR